jgi:serine protease Do
VRIALALTGTALALGSVVTLAIQSPAGAQDADPVKTPQNAPATVPSVGPGGAPRSFADLTARLSPAVVNISTTQQVEVGRFPGIQPGSPLEELFRRFQEQQGEDGRPVTREATSLGSGFFISPDGFIVTNNHVVSGRDGNEPVDTITVTLQDRREYKARIVGRDQLADLAVLKIDGAGNNLPYVQFGQSERVRVGDWAIAIGNPLGLAGTVTAGIVSALHRNIGSGQYDRYIQTDASINQGNSGGPLFDLSGNVIGVNTAIFSPTGGNVGLGFAIPAELARPVVEQLRTTGRVRRGYLGVNIQPLTSDIAAGLGLPRDRGEIVANVEPTGPAARAGIRQGDVILRINGQEVTYDNTLSYIVANTRIGATVPIELLRGGKRQTVNATVGERPTEATIQGDRDQEEQRQPNRPDQGDTATRQSLGLNVQSITPEIRRQLRLAENVQGVVITNVSPASDAAANGLRRGDVIISINQQPTTTPAAAAAAVAAARAAGRETVLILAQRGNNPPAFFGIKLVPAPGPARR